MIHLVVVGGQLVFLSADGYLRAADTVGIAPHKRTVGGIPVDILLKSVVAQHNVRIFAVFVRDIKLYDSSAEISERRAHAVLVGQCEQKTLVAAEKAEFLCFNAHFVFLRNLFKVDLLDINICRHQERWFSLRVQQ